MTTLMDTISSTDGGTDYDCSSLIISAWQQAGVPVKTKGAAYTGNMKSTFLACGFTDVTSRVNLQTGNGMKRGDVIINTLHHTVMYIGNGRIVAARINENGKVSGGKTGDQTGMEIMAAGLLFLSVWMGLRSSLYERRCNYRYQFPIGSGCFF